MTRKVCQLSPITDIFTVDVLQSTLMPHLPDCSNKFDVICIFVVESKRHKNATWPQRYNNTGLNMNNFIILLPICTDSFLFIVPGAVSYYCFSTSEAFYEKYSY